MKKDTTPSAPSNLEHHLKQAVSDTDYPVFDWLEKHGRTLAIAGAALLALLFIFYRMSVGNTAQFEKDYFTAAQDFAVFQRGVQGQPDSKAQQVALDNLRQLMQRHPDLLAKYDGLLAQTLLNRNAIESAVPLADQTLTRVQNENIPYYEEYARTSLLISQSSYVEALKQATALKGKMLTAAKNEPRTFGDTLFAFNLLRIPMLQQKAGTPTEELAAWAEWKAYANGSRQDAGIDSKAFSAVEHLFDEGQLTLANYIAAREKALNK